ncbi:hypothetical protein EXD88_19425, partial [Acinetobacter pittii]
SSRLNICYYHQDLHLRRLHPGPRPRLQGSPQRPSYSSRRSVRGGGFPAAAPRGAGEGGEGERGARARGRRAGEAPRRHPRDAPPRPPPPATPASPGDRAPRSRPSRALLRLPATAGYGPDAPAPSIFRAS